MTIVTAQMSVSADGFYAGPKHTGRQTWLEGPQAAGFFRVTRWAIDAEAWRQRLGFKGGEDNTNSEVIAETFESAGAYVMGRRMADGGEMPPFRASGIRGHQPAAAATRLPRTLPDAAGPRGAAAALLGLLRLRRDPLDARVGAAFIAIFGRLTIRLYNRK